MLNQAIQNSCRKYVFPALLLALVYFPLFLNLDRLPLAQFDEARVAMSSYEMHKNNNFLVVHYANKPDMWSTKPPLTNWAQVFFIKTLGLNVLSVRLPSAIAGFLTCVLLWLFSLRFLKNPWIAFVSVVVLVTSVGFIQNHVIRTADYDAMLVLFTTASAFSYFLFIESSNYKYLRWFFILLALAVLTKSIAGLFLLPGLLLFSLFRYKQLAFLAKKQTYLYALYFIVPVVAYYGGRELVNPGYLKAVWHWDIAGRYKEQLTGDAPYFGYYLHLLMGEHFRYWFWIAVAGIPLGLLIKNKPINSAVLFTTCTSVCFLIVLSSARTQMLWYAAPVYPFIALLAAAAIYWGIDFLNTTIHNLQFNFLPFLLIVVVSFIPYKNAVSLVNPPKMQHEWEHEAQAFNYFLIDAYQKNKNLDGYSWIDNDLYNPYIDFYVKMFEENKKQKITQKTLEELKIGDTVVVFLESTKPYIQAFDLHFEPIDSFGNFVKIYKIDGARKPIATTDF